MSQDPPAPQQIKAGDHVKICYGLYWHHGIAVEGGMVISNTVEGVVMQTLLEFKDSRPVHIVEHETWRRRPPATIVETAEQCFFEHTYYKSHAHGRTYDLLRWNCEHFANYCVTGKLHAGSGQVRNAVGMGLWTAVTAAISPLGAAAILAVGLATMVTP